MTQKNGCGDNIAAVFILLLFGILGNIDYQRVAGCDAGQKYAKLRHPRLGEKNSETY